MTDSNRLWAGTFRDLFNLAVEKHSTGKHEASGLVDEKGRAFLDSIGYTEQEFFDFVEDFAKGGEPTLETALAIAEVRRDYFLQVQGGVRSPNTIKITDLPAKSAELDGIEWLPRLIPKALAKLHGEMPPDLMFCCGGDRRFFRVHGIEPAAFLRETWKTNGDPQAISAWIKSENRAVATMT